MVKHLVCQYEQSTSYDKIKVKKIWYFFAITWLIFTGPVTYVKNFIEIRITYASMFEDVVNSHSKIMQICVQICRILQDSHIILCDPLSKNQHSSYLQLLLFNELKNMLGKVQKPKFAKIIKLCLLLKDLYIP